MSETVHSGTGDFLSSCSVASLDELSPCLQYTGRIRAPLDLHLEAGLSATYISAEGY